MSNERVNFVKITGIIAEYNPFHNGHKYQIEEARKFSDSIVSIMSGSFVQRGGIAITDKWTRAQIAINNGVDLVLELPVIYSMNTAQKFASGAVKLLDKTKVIDNLCFGSECGDIKKLSDAAEILLTESKDISAKIKSFLDSGMSYPMAREKAHKGHIESGILSEPNNILAIEYIKALMKNNSKIKPVTLTRKGTGYHDNFSNGNMASASAIRDMIIKGEKIEEFVPRDDFRIYDESMLDASVISKLRTMTKGELSNINDVTEGLENRIKDAINFSSSIDELCNNIKTKRYPMSRIRRIVFSALLGITKDIINEDVNYVRILAMNETGAKILKEIKEKSEFDIITKVADYKKDSLPFKKDILSTDIFALCGREKMGMDFRKSPIIIK